MSVRLGQERRPFRIGPKITTGIALLGLLALRAAAQTQTIEATIYGFQEHCAKALLVDDFGSLAANPGRFDAASAATAVGRARSGNSPSRQSLVFASFHAFIGCRNKAPHTNSSSLLTYVPQFYATRVVPSAAPGDRSADDSKNQPSNIIISRRSEPADFNRSIYYKNKLEFS